MSDYQPYLEWIDSRRDIMLERVMAWSAINSGSTNLDGLARMWATLEKAFAPLGGDIREITLAPHTLVGDDGVPRQQQLGRAFLFSKRPQAPVKVLLAIHMDTVFAADHPFQSPRMLDDGRLNGPGVADAKGGIAIILSALEALERSPFADDVGIEVFLNPDEEIGSPGSAPHLVERAAWADLGLLYEPALPDGTLAGARKGSGNFTCVIRGKAAHAGREHHLGRNAVVALAAFISAIDALNGQRPGVTVNAGRIDGGGPVNIVPDLALGHFNIRVATVEEQHWAEAEVARIVAEIGARDGIDATLYGAFGRPPKILSATNKRLFEALGDCGRDLGIAIAHKATGGCCDGNNLAAAGLPNIDTLGVRGGAIHSPAEFMLLDSLTERAKLSALFLMKLGAGDIQWPPENPHPADG